MEVTRNPPELLGCPKTIGPTSPHLNKFLVARGDAKSLSARRTRHRPWMLPTDAASAVQQRSQAHPTDQRFIKPKQVNGVLNFQ
jgi:hypothetical protein